MKDILYPEEQKEVDTQRKLKRWRGTWPADCQICGIELQTVTPKKFYDFKTFDGRWALGCQRCFIAFGIGLGNGVGQCYDSETLNKLGG